MTTTIAEAVKQMRAAVRAEFAREALVMVRHKTAWGAKEIFVQFAHRLDKERVMRLVEMVDLPADATLVFERCRPIPPPDEPQPGAPLPAVEDGVR